MSDIIKQHWWINPNDPEMCDWAYYYLLRRFEIAQEPRENTHYARCCLFINSLNDEKRELLLIKMKAAWRQKKYRDKQKSMGNKPCSFFLSRSSLKQLKELATYINVPINETLERLIKHNYLESRSKKKKGGKEALPYPPRHA